MWHSKPARSKRKSDGSGWNRYNLDGTIHNDPKKKPVSTGTMLLANLMASSAASIKAAFLLHQVLSLLQSYVVLQLLLLRQVQRALLKNIKAEAVIMDNNYSVASFILVRLPLKLFNSAKIKSNFSNAP